MTHIRATCLIEEVELIFLNSLDLLENSKHSIVYQWLTIGGIGSPFLWTMVSQHLEILKHTRQTLDNDKMVDINDG